MKKIYVIFSLLLMVMGINTAFATVNLGAQITDPKTLKANDKIILRANKPINADADPVLYKFMASLADSMTFARTEASTMDPYVSMILEDAQTQVKGKKAFYIKNEFNGKYITYKFIEGTEEEDGSILEDGSIEIYLAYTSDKAKATPVHITTQKEGGEMMGYKGNAPEDANCIMFIAELKENNNSLIAFNYVYDRPLIASYNDYATWWQVFKAEIKEDYVADLKALYTKVENINYQAGTNPGCYDKTLVEAYNKAKTEAGNTINTPNPDAKKCEAAYKALESAYLALVTAKAVDVKNEGYYRLVSANKAFADKQKDVKYAVYGNLADSHVKWGQYNEEEATQVWQMVKREADGSWFLYNIGTGQYLNGTNGNAEGAAWYAMGDSTSTKQTFFENLGMAQFNIKFNGSNAFHAGGHKDGAGTDGPVIAYNAGKDSPSAWFIQAVDEKDIPKFEEIGKQNALNRDLQKLFDLANAKYTIGSSFKVETDTTKWLVTSKDYAADKNVVFSNADHNAWHPDAPDGQGYAALLDTANATYWGSCWKEPAPEAKHFLQFKLNKKVNTFALLLDRRKNQGNQATQLEFFVSNDTSKAENWVKAGIISGLPANTHNITKREDLLLQTTGVELGGEYQYVRVYLTSNSGLVKGQHFTHFAGFHFQPATLDPNCQNAKLGDVAKNLKTALNKAMIQLDQKKATQEMIDELQKAFDAYVAELADPTTLKQKVDSIKGVIAIAATPSMKSKEGSKDVFSKDEPGVYTDEAQTALQNVIKGVEEYIAKNDASGTYTKAELDAQTKTLNDGFAAFKAAQGQIKATSADDAGIWYYIKASKNYFDVTGKQQETKGEGDNLQIRNGFIYVDVKNANEDILNDARLRVTGNKTMEEIGKEDDYAKWRFVNLGDTAYAIQNKATGLYMSERTVGNAGLSITPSAIKVEELGYATFLLGAYNFNGAKINQMHTQTDGQVIVFWGDRTLGGGSCFDIKPTTTTGEPANDVMYSPINLRTVVKGKLYTMCYPVGLEYVADEKQPVANAYKIATIDNEKKEMTLTTLDGEISGGTPFFYIAGGKKIGVSENPTAEDTIKFSTTMIENTLDIVGTPLTENGLIGNYYNGTKIEKGFGFLTEEDGKQMIAPANSGQTIGWNSAYIDAAQITNGEEGEIKVPLKGELSTSIEDAINDAIIGNVNVYTIDGILVKKNVKPSEATKGLVKGIYIVGNKKVAIQ